MLEFYGLLGEKLSHSLSPRIHELILQKINEEGAYKLFEVNREDLKDFIKAIKLLKIQGINVTIPYKEEVIKYLDDVSKEAKRIGAINTIYLEKNKLYGYNTDYYGFGYMLEYNNIAVENKVAVVLGNGGACKAAVYYLLDNNVKGIYVVSRAINSVDKFCNEKVKIIDYDELKNIKGDILINSTPVGMYPKVGVSPVNSEIIDNFNVLVDLIYNPKETEFLSIGKSLGKETVSGLFMLVGQGVKAQEIWQNRKIDKEVIKDIYYEISLLLS